MDTVILLKGRAVDALVTLDNAICAAYFALNLPQECPL